MDFLNILAFVEHFLNIILKGFDVQQIRLIFFIVHSEVGQSEGLVICAHLYHFF